MQVPFSYVHELGPSTKILFPMAVFLPRLMMLKVSMHENAREKRAASILENMNLLKQLICTLMPLYHFIVPSWFGDSERLWKTNAMHIRLNFRFVPKLWGGGRGRSTHQFLRRFQKFIFSAPLHIKLFPLLGIMLCFYETIFEQRAQNWRFGELWWPKNGCWLRQDIRL